MHVLMQVLLNLLEDQKYPISMYQDNIKLLSLLSVTIGTVLHKIVLIEQPNLLYFV